MVSVRVQFLETVVGQGGARWKLWVVPSEGMEEGLHKRFYQRTFAFSRRQRLDQEKGVALPRDMENVLFPLGESSLTIIQGKRPMESSRDVP